MIYEYFCEKCEHTFDVVKPVSELSRIEPCPQCGNHIAHTVISPRLYFNNAKVENAEFNHGLGGVVRNRKHRDEVARRRGLIEVGSESTESLRKETEVKKQQEREREWKDLG